MPRCSTILSGTISRRGASGSRRRLPTSGAGLSAGRPGARRRWPAGVRRRRSLVRSGGSRCQPRRVQWRRARLWAARRRSLLHRAGGRARQLPGTHLLRSVISRCRLGRLARGAAGGCDSRSIEKNSAPACADQIRLSRGLASRRGPIFSIAGGRDAAREGGGRRRDVAILCKKVPERSIFGVYVVNKRGVVVQVSHFAHSRRVVWRGRRSWSVVWWTQHGIYIIPSCVLVPSGPLGG